MAFPLIGNLSEQQWHQMSVDDITNYLNTDLSTGLSAIEVAQRQEIYGFNQLKGKKGKSAIARFLMGFNQPLIYILLVSGTVALLLQDWVDAGVILGVTLINAAIGFVQESKAEDAIAHSSPSTIAHGQFVMANFGDFDF